MPLQAILDESAFSGLDESLKTLYRQNSENNQYYLDLAPDEAGKLAFNLQSEKEKLAKNNQELLKQKGEVNSKLKAWESLGKTPEEIKQTLESNRPEEVTKLVTDYEAKIKSLQESFDETVKKEAEARAKAQSMLEKTLVESQISRLRADFDLNDTADFVLKEFLRPERNEDTGEISLAVYENGSPALVAGQPKTPEQLLKGFREQKKYLSIFNGGDGAGTGLSARQMSASPGAKTMKRADFERLPPQSRHDFIVTQKGQLID